MERNLKNVLVVSFGFLLLFTAYGGLQSLQPVQRGGPGRGCAQHDLRRHAAVLHVPAARPHREARLQVDPRACHVLLCGLLPGQLLRQLSSGVWGNLISSLVFGQTPTQGTVPEEQLQACGASDCLMAVASTNSTKRPSQDLVYTLMGIYTVLHHLRPGDPVRGLRDDLLRGRRRPVLRALREAGPVHWEDRALRAGGSDPAGLHHCPPAVEAAPQPAARVLRVPRPLGHGRRGLADTEQRSRQVTSWSPTAPGAMKRHGNGTSSTDTWPNSRAKRQPLSAPLGPEPPGETPRPPLSSHFLVAAQPSPPRVRGPFPCPIPPAPPPLSLRYPLQGPGLPGRPLPSDACRQRLWPPRTPAQLSAVTHPPLDRPLSPASPPMGSNPCLHTPAGCPSLTHSRPLLPTGTGPVGLAPGTSSSPALSVAS
ncbi:protein unc-93 homolog A isoform X4 [Ovis aries]|uniref:protein unc-93 homolog A isoform X4 n=1 Tax=Ovis aries TaxID=9940 RepID=UPI001C2E5D80|nr:protein unc-93 homolog A isoform X4 [Ovis aries]